MTLERYSYNGPIDHTITPKLENVKGKSVIVTGGANGMGEAFVRDFVAAGAYVTFADVNEKRGQAIESELNVNATACTFVKCDITDWDQQKAVFEKAKSQSPSNSVDIVIANAGISRSSGDSLWNLDDPNGEPTKPDLNIVRVNIDGTFYTWKLAVHYFRKQPVNEERDRCFIITGSMVAWIDSPGNWEYTATKYGLRGFMRTVRRSSHEQNIRINYVAPCWIKSAIRTAEYEKWLIDHGVEFGEQKDVSSCMLRIATDKSINGRSLMITPRTIAKEGFVDIDREDYKDTPEDEYLKKVQASQLVIIQDKWLDDYKVRIYKDSSSSSKQPSHASQLRAMSPTEDQVPTQYQPWQSALRHLFIQDNPVVSGIKTDMEESKPGSMPFSTTNATVNDLLELLPPASHCEELKRIYFNTFAPLFHILHDPTFEADYRRFQSDPEKASLPWLALLFAILGIAVIALPTDSPLFRELGKRNSTPDNMSLLSSRYRGAAMKCLEADHYLWRHNLNTLQALVILIYGINHTHGQSWALLGAARNIALSLGCHVDPEVFQMDRIRVEERRRCWAGLNMLYTIQNTTLGMLDVAHASITVRLPLDVNDDELVAGYQIPQSREGPTQMSYLLLKFELYDLCTRICGHVFEASQTISYDKVQALDAEISAMQETFNYKYIFDVPLVAHHAVQLNILFGYTHQLTLLLHRPILRQGASGCTPDNRLCSQNKCIESSKALLDIHRTLYEDPAFRPYHWYSRGLGSFHAFHAAVCLAHIYMSSTNLDTSTKASFQELVRDSIQVFRYFMNTGRRDIINTQESRDSSRANESMSKQADLSHQNEVGLLDEYIENLAPQQWLSPSNMGWEGWAMILDDESMANVF
ncbi:hypothetical protein HG530_009202 [Fusarium avenaceum]|nr:hypothetical protein HG530_009202 [Fusarium avenaceum]